MQEWVTWISPHNHMTNTNDWSFERNVLTLPRDSLKSPCHFSAFSSLLKSYTCDWVSKEMLLVAENISKTIQNRHGNAIERQELNRYSSISMESDRLPYTPRPSQSRLVKRFPAVQRLSTIWRCIFTLSSLPYTNKILTVDYFNILI